MKDNVIQEFMESIKTDPEKKQQVYSATVSRIDSEGTVWVFVAGSNKETPTSSTSASVKSGDEVNVMWQNNKLYIVGNYSDPSSGIAKVRQVEMAANTAREAANNAVVDAGRARQAAEEAEATANSVRGIAVDAQTNAGIAKTAADKAMYGLSQVEDVVGVVNWMKTHGNYKVSTDTSPQENVIYFSVAQVASPTGNPRENLYYEYDSTAQEYSLTLDTVVVDDKSYFTITEQTPVETDNPAQNGWIELTNLKDVVADYVNTHLALTDKGLYVLGGETEWKVLVGNDGVYIIDSENNVVSYYKDVIVLGKDDGSQSFVRMDYHSMQMFDRENASRSDGVPYFWISDLRNKDGIYHIEENIVFSSSYPSTIKINLVTTAIINDNYIVTVNDVVWENVEKNKSYIKFPSNDLPPDGSTVKISYDSSSNHIKAYTLGIRLKNSFVAPFSYAEGAFPTASGYCSHAEGYYTTASGAYSHAEGNYNTASGDYSHAEGYINTASGKYSHAEGHDTTASGVYSHAEGHDTTASGYCSHAEGESTTASGYRSHAEGESTTASGDYSHAEGYNTTASGYCSHAEGHYTKASGSYSHAGGYFTKAEFQEQTVIGEYNKNNFKNAFEIGNGSDDDDEYRSNAFEVDWDGNVNASGKFYQNGSELQPLPKTGTTTAGSVTWKYKKYADGSLEMWGSGNTTLAISTPSGNLFTTANEYDIAMPSFVSAIDFITAELSGAGWADITGFSVPPKLRLYAPTSFGSASRVVRYYLRGSWI